MTDSSKISIGAGATIRGYTDRYAATIVAHSKTLSSITVQRDLAFRTDTNGKSEIQTYRFEPNTKCLPEVFTLRKNGKWHAKGTPIKDNFILLIGERDHYFDFSF